MLKRPQLFKEAEMLRTPKNIIAQVIIFVIVFFVAAIGESLIALPKVDKEIMDYIRENNIVIGSKDYYYAVNHLQLSDTATIISLFATLFATLLIIFYCRCIECRPVTSIGMKKKGGLKSYFCGLLIGFVMMSLITGSGYLVGAFRAEHITFDINYTIFFLFLGGFLIQGMSEEFIFRGYFMNTLGSFSPMPVAIVLSAAGFAAAHLMNPGITVLAFINLTLFGVFASLVMIVTDNIWVVSGIHSMWNFTQGNIYGISVSGTGSGECLIKSDMKEGMSLINGGEFGIEGGLLTTLILSVGIALVFVYNNKKNKSAE